MTSDDFKPRFYQSFPQINTANRTSSPGLNGLEVKDHFSDSEFARLQPYDKRALQILANVLQFGPLLGPETLHVPTDASVQSPWPVKCLELTQVRSCFTLCARHELIPLDGAKRPGAHYHCDVFGPYSIGIAYADGRKLGLTPVIYYHSTEDVVSAEMLVRLRELRDLLGVLATIEARSSGFDQQYVTTRDVDALVRDAIEPYDATRKAILAADARQLDGILDLIRTQRVPFYNLFEWIDIFYNFFQITEPPKAEALAYYRQKEWRVIHVTSPTSLYVPLNIELFSKRFRPEDVDSWEREIRRLRRNIQCTNATYFTDARLDTCGVMFGVQEKKEDRRFGSFIEEIVAPAERKNDVRRVLENFGDQASSWTSTRKGDFVVFELAP